MNQNFLLNHKNFGLFEQIYIYGNTEANNEIRPPKSRFFKFYFNGFCIAVITSGVVRDLRNTRDDLILIAKHFG